MKTFSSDFEREKNKKVGAAPVWILKCPFQTGTRYLSDRVVSVAGWDGGITTKSWVQDWGTIDEDISGELSSSKISDFELTIINDPNDIQNLESILWNPSNNLETIDCELYLYFLGLYHEILPQKMWVGNIVDFRKEDELMYTLQLIDNVIKIDKYVGSKIDISTYPSADPDDIGKIKNIIYGSVTKCPAHIVDAGAMTSLPNNINSSVTSFSVSDGSRLSSGKVIQIDGEQIYISTISENTITSCTRGYNSTLPATHLKGAVVWEKKTQFVYLFADHPVKTIGNIYGRVGDVEINITSICTKYTGQSGNELSEYSGKAVINVPGYVTVSQAVDMLVSDGISVNDAIVIVDSIGVSDTIAVIDGIGIDDTISVSDLIGVSDGIGVSDLIEVSDGIGVSDLIGVSDGIGVTHSDSGSTTAQVQGSQNAAYIYDYTSIGNGEWKLVVGFNDPPSGSSQFQYNLYLSLIGYFTSDGTIEIKAGPFNDATLVTVAYLKSATSAWEYYPSLTFDSIPNQTIYIKVIMTGGAYLLDVNTLRCDRTYKYTGAFTGSGVATKTGSATKTGTAVKIGSASKMGSATKTGSAVKTGSASKAGTVTLVGNSVANTLVGDAILISGEGYQDDASGTITGTANALIERPDHVVKHFLKFYGNWNISNFYSNAGSYFSTKGYKFSGVINEYKKLKEWLSYMAFQCRCYFRFYNCKAQLLYRPDTLSSKKTISKNMIRMNEDAKLAMKIYRSPIYEVINKINLHYDRDWTQSGEGAYRALSKSSNSESITKYGEKEKPDLFYFDFVRLQSMADDLHDFYINRYKDRKKVVEMEVFLDNSELEFTDGVEIGALNNLACEVQKVNICPGSGHEMINDKIMLILKEY